MGVTEILREVLTLTSSVGALKADVQTLQGVVQESRERIIKLENREEVLAADMACKATEAVSRMTGEMVTRLTRLEERFLQRGQPPETPKLTGE